MDNRPSLTAAVAAEIYIGLVVWIALMAAKALGAPFRVSWSVLGFGVIYIPFAFVALLIAILILQTIASALRKRIALQMKRHRIKREIRKIILSLTLNGVGEFFKVKRIPGEPNVAYMQRIGSQANKVSPIAMDLMIRSEKHHTLNAVGSIYGVNRKENESDVKYQRRMLREISRAIKLEGGSQHAEDQR